MESIVSVEYVLFLYHHERIHCGRAFVNQELCLHLCCCVLVTKESCISPVPVLWDLEPFGSKWPHHTWPQGLTVLSVEIVVVVVLSDM